MPSEGSTPTLLFQLYRAATGLIAPLAFWSVSRKLRAHGVAEPRIRERLGRATLPRPKGLLIWFHAASVGESLSVLTLITRMGERLPGASFLITSGTATSADLIARRLPPRSSHQFAPLDAASAVQRFLSHWRPNAGVFVESELWPLTLVRARAGGTPLALLNARLSDRSVDAWVKRPKTARFVLDQFSLLMTQNQKAADNLLAMGADPGRVVRGGNLKSTSAPLPIDGATLSQMRDELGGRPVWIASSTHPGEEAAVLAAHRALLVDRPDLCLVLIPRHPARGNAVAALIAEAGLTQARRSIGEIPGPDAQVYLADTLGETGTWYALSPIVFLGGSLQPIGGHNPFEPALAGAAVITGPHYSNFTETYEPLIVAGGAVEVSDGDSAAQAIAGAVAVWLDRPEQLQSAIAAAGAFAQAQQSALDGIIDRLCEALRLGPGHA